MTGEPKDCLEKNPLEYLKIYLKGRINPKSEEKMPWLNYQLVSFMEQQKRGLVVEFGSGRSTIWLAKSGFQVLSIEHQQKWATQVSDKLKSEGLAHMVDYNLVPADPQKLTDVSLYLRPLLQKKLIESLSFILVDGIFRNQCLKACEPFLRKGVPVILHDSNRFEYWPAISRLALISKVQLQTIYGPGYGTPDFTWAKIFSVPLEAPATGRRSLDKKLKIRVKKNKTIRSPWR